MKKFTLFLLGVAVFVAIVFVAAPVLAGAAIGSTLLFRGVQLVATTAGIPAWAAALIFIALIPSALWWCFRILTPKVRRRLVIMLIVVGALYALATAVLGNQHLVAAAQSAAAAIQKLLPIKPAHPVTEAWFFLDGQPRLFYVHPATNIWRFYQGAYLAGAHDPVTGVVLQPVTPLIREQWQADQAREREAEMANEQQAERLALEVRRQQLESLSDSLNRQKVALHDERQSVLTNLLQRLEAKQQYLAGAVAKMPDSPLQAVTDASQKLAGARATLAAAMTNGTLLDSASAQAEVQDAVSNADLAEDAIHAASAAQEKARQAALDAETAKAALGAKEQHDAAELKRLAADANQSRQPNPVAQSQPVMRRSQSRLRFWSRPNEDSADLWIENRTPFTICFVFSSPQFQHIWPALDRAYVAAPGQTVHVSLRGNVREPIYFSGWTPANPYVRWGNRHFDAVDQPPVATCGESGPVSVLVQ
jgi:hypothetical protein